MPVPSFVTQQNVKFDGTTTNCVVVSTSPTKVILWDKMSLGDQTRLTTLINQYGGVLPFVAQAGYQTVEFTTPVIGANTTGLNPLAAPTAGTAAVVFSSARTTATLTRLPNTTFNGTTRANPKLTAEIIVDGVAKHIAINGRDAQTFGELVTVLNAALGSSATASLSGSTLLITSNSTGKMSTVGISDRNLFTRLSGFLSYGTPMNGRIPTTYTATISFDGVDVAFSATGDVLQTFDDLQTALETAIDAAGVVTVSGQSISFASATTGNASTVKLVDGNLFKSLVTYKGIKAAVAGVATFPDALKNAPSPLGQGSSLFHYFATLTLTSKPATIDRAFPARVYYDGTVWRYWKTDVAVGSTPAL